MRLCVVKHLNPSWALDNIHRNIIICNARPPPHTDIIRTILVYENAFKTLAMKTMVIIAVQYFLD